MGLVLDIDISNSINRFFDNVFEWLPELVAALVVLLIGWIVARLLAAVVRNLSERTGVDRPNFCGRCQ